MAPKPVRPSHALRSDGGRWWIEWRGRREPPLFYCTPDPDAEAVRRFREAGVVGVSFTATADFHPYRLAQPVWTAPGTYDYAELDRRARAALAGAPDACLIPRVHLCSPPWWDAEHPQELVTFADRRPEDPFLHGYSKSTCVSWSSRAWRAAAAENLRHFARHVARQDYGENVGGILVASGNTEEWFQVGTMEGWLPDYSEPARVAFADWALSRYPGPNALAERWGVPVDPDRIEIPPKQLRRRPSVARFRDPRAQAWVLDFDAFLADEAATFIGDLCGVIGEESGGRWFAGAFFGYLIEMPFHGEGVFHGGHLGLSQLLADPRVDFLASPGSYTNRDLRRGAAQTMMPLGSLRRAGKAAFHENDVRTHLLFDNAGYGWTETPSLTASAQVREAGLALANGMGFWWFDMTGSFYDDPATLAAVTEVVSCAREPWSAPPRVDVAFVIDEDSLAVTDYWSDRYADVIPRQMTELSRAGVSHEAVLLDELDESHGYTWLVFPNLFRVEARTLERVRRLVRGAKGALFIGAVGLAPTSAGEGPGVAQVTGLPATAISRASPVEVRLTAPDLLVAGEPSGFGRRFWQPWLVSARPEEVDVLGVHAATAEPALFRGHVSGRQVSYSADAVVPAHVLRRLARDAGVHVWMASGDWCSVNGAILAITARAAGVRDVCVPAGLGLRALPSGGDLPLDRGVAHVPMAAGASMILRITVNGR